MMVDSWLSFVVNVTTLSSQDISLVSLGINFGYLYILFGEPFEIVFSRLAPSTLLGICIRQIVVILAYLFIISIMFLPGTTMIANDPQMTLNFADLISVSVHIHHRCTTMK